MHSFFTVCNLLAYSKSQHSKRFSCSSVKDVSTTAQNASLSDTASFLEKESQSAGSLVPSEGVRLLCSCSQTMESQWSPCHGCHQAPLRQARHPGPPGQPLSQRAGHLVGLCSMKALYPLPEAVPHALTPCSFPCLSH